MGWRSVNGMFKLIINVLKLIIYISVIVMFITILDIFLKRVDFQYGGSSNQSDSALRTKCNGRWNDANVSPHSPKFASVLTNREKGEFLELLSVVTREMTANNVTYFLSDGSLIGSWRHHGFIPWDDDVDLFVDSKQRYKLLRVSETCVGLFIHLFINSFFFYLFTHI